jgi:indoleamine 2,3-dioxygenase
MTASASSGHPASPAALYTPDKIFGFLNASAEVTTLPADYAKIEQVAANLGDLLKDGTLRTAMNTAAPVQIPEGLTHGQYKRLWTIYAMIASAYVFSIYETQNAAALPVSLASPLYALSQRLGMPPIMNYAAFVENNFRFTGEHDRMPRPEDFEPLFTFSSPQDGTTHAGEKWFIAVQAAAEKAIAPAITQIPAAQAALLSGDDATVIRALQEITTGLNGMTDIMMRLPERLDPALYERTPLQYVFSFKGIHFDGVPAVQGVPQIWRGESGGQSAVPRVLAAFLGIEQEPVDMTALGEYMDPGHRAFVARLKTGPSVKSMLEQRPALTAAYNDTIQALGHFRRNHGQIARQYVGPDAFAPGPSGSHYLRDNILATNAASFRAAPTAG